MLNTAKSQNTITMRSLAPLHPGELGIKITATAINPVDWKMRDHDAILSKYPSILGSDAGGTVVEVGADISNFAIGDRVFFQGIIDTPDSSTFQEYCKIPAELVAKTPSNITDEQGAGISLATMAVVTAFYDKTGHGMKPPWEDGGDKVGHGKAIVIIGGASSVGQYAIQMAKLSGFDRIITNASNANHEMLKSLGADVVFDRQQSGPEDFKAAVGEIPLDFVFDSISASTTQLLGVKILQATKTKGSHLVTVYVVHPEAVDPDALALGQLSEPQVPIKQGMRHILCPLEFLIFSRNLVR